MNTSFALNDPVGAFVPHGHFTLPPTHEGLLSGLRFAAKDVFDVAGHPTGAGNPDWLASHPLSSAIPLEAEPGDVAFFHYFTLHGSMPNRSSETRKTVLVQMYAGDDRVEDGITHPDEKWVLSGWNHHAKRGSAGAMK